MTVTDFDRLFPATAPTKNDEAFRAWMQQVDLAILRKTGLCSNDLPDYCYRDAFDDGASPARAARHAILAAEEF